MTIRTAGRRSLHAFARGALALAVPTVALFAATSANAQSTSPSPSWLSDKRVGQGQGISAGDLELHPGIGGEIGYDSNWFLRTYHEGAGLTNGGPANPPVAGGILRITPSLSLNTKQAVSAVKDGLTPAPTPFNLAAALQATYMEFFGPQELRDQRNVSGSANIHADINRGRPIVVDLGAGYARLIQPDSGNPDVSFNRSDITAGGGLSVVPGAGTFDMRLGYQFYGAFFEDSEGVPYTNITHEISFRDRWRFRPRTALFSDTTLRFISYPNADRATSFLNDSTPVRTRFGVTGLITDRLGALLAAGYGATFFKDPAAASSPQYDSVTGQAELTWYLSQNPGSNEPGASATLLLSTIQLGYVRDFQNSLLANFYTSNKGYINFNYFFGPRAVLQIGGAFQDLEYPTVFFNTGAGPQQATDGTGQPLGAFTNYRVTGTAFGEYRLTDSVGLNATFIYDQMISDTQVSEGGPPPAGAPVSSFDLAWRRIQAFIGVRWFL